MSVNGLGGTFNRALDGLRISSSGINNASNNIANVNTEGYNRQILEQGSRALEGGGFIGGGVLELGTSSFVSPFVERQLANETSEFGTFDGRQLTTSNIENVLYESDNEGIGGAINQFFNSWSELTVDPSNGAFRQGVREKANLLIDRFHSTHEQLSNLRASLSGSIKARVDQINNKLDQIADINQSVRNATNDRAKLELKGERQLLIRKLSEDIGVNYFENSDETINIQLQGTGFNLVQGNRSATLSVSENLSAGGQMTINASTSSSSSETDVTSNITSGRLGGNLIDRNTTLNNRLSELDDLAFQLSSDVNAAHVDGFGLDGTDQRNFFAPLGSSTNAASNIELDSSVKNNLDAIAAAQEDPAISGVGDGRQASSILALQDSLALDGGTKTYAQFYSAMVSSAGIEAANVNDGFDSKGNLLNKLQQQRENISGVNIDEEAADLIKYQRAFEGSARVMTIAGDMLQTLLRI